MKLFIKVMIFLIALDNYNLILFMLRKCFKKLTKNFSEKILKKDIESIFN